MPCHIFPYNSFTILTIQRLPPIQLLYNNYSTPYPIPIQLLPPSPFNSFPHSSIPTPFFIFASLTYCFSLVKNLQVESSVWSSFEERGGEFNKVLLTSAIQLMVIGHEKFNVKHLIYNQHYANVLGML